MYNTLDNNIKDKNLNFERNFSLCKTLWKNVLPYLVKGFTLHEFPFDD